MIPRFSESGQWRVRTVTLRDVVGNSVFLSADDLSQRGFPTDLMVTGQQDVTPPALAALSFATNVDTSSSAATVSVHLSATDDLSGVSFLAVTFESPSGRQYESAAATYFQPSLSVAAIADVTFPQFCETGAWKVRTVHALDEAGNSTSILETDLAQNGFPTSLLVTGREDVSPPALTALSFAPAINTVSGPATVAVHFSVTDDLSGLTFLAITFVSPSGRQRQSAAASSFAPATSVSGVIDVLFPQFSEVGEWKMELVTLRDLAGNYSTLSTSALASAGLPTRIAVQDASMSLHPSALVFAATYDRSHLTPAQTVTLNFQDGVVDWTASSDQPWLRVSPASGSGVGTLTLSLVPASLPMAANSTATATIMAPGALNSPLTISCSLTMKATTAAPFGSFDTPSNNATGLASNIPVTGWALDDIGIDKVTLWRDPIGSEPRSPNGLVYIADAVFVPDARPDVSAGYPTTPMSYRGGWGYLMLTNFLPGSNGGASGNGTYRIYAYALDLEGNQTLLGSKLITVDNANSTKPFGTIDTPAQGETVSGVTYVNFGWALTPQPNLVPIDGSTLWVVVDGVFLGHPFYNQYRSDIATLFPSYLNSNGAVGYYLLDKTTLANGMHNIAWAVTDNGGRQDGIGSRYFWVLNQAAQGTRPQNLPTVEKPEVVSYRTGYGIDLPVQPIRTGGEGIYETLELNELDRIEIHLPGAGPWQGGLRVDGELRPLPVGSTLDEANGVFYWQLGPGFLGDYILEFSGTDGVTSPNQIPVRVRTRAGVY
jgi:hypothetical protein